MNIPYKKSLFNLIFFFLIFFILLNNKTLSYENYYWSKKNYAINSKEEAVKKLFKKKKLEKLEGIWMQDNFGLVAIVGEKKRRNLYFQYSKYVINNKIDSSLNGTRIATLRRTKYPELFIVFERSDHIIDDKELTLTGKLTSNITLNKAEVLIRGSNKIKKINRTYTLKKIYP